MKDKKYLAVGKKKISLIALALVSVMLLSLPGQGIGRAKADPIDLEIPCSLTVQPGDMANREELAELKNEDVVIDLYKVAGAKKVPGYDTYEFDFGENNPYGALARMLEGKEADYRAAAQAAAEITFTKDDNGSFSHASIDAGLVQKNLASGTKIENLESGLYLLVARSPKLAEASDYVTEVTVKGSEGQADFTQIATIAHSDHYTYTFLPELIALPTKDAVMVNGENLVNTANPGDWITDLNVTLKPQPGPRYGDLQIRKNLEGYGGQEASFVFQIEAYTADPAVEPDAKLVYSDVRTIQFGGEGSQELKLSGLIPVGSYVLVTEVYPGPSYRLDGAQTQDVVIPVPENGAAGLVEFTNIYQGTTTSGSVITNHFEYHEENTETRNAEEAGWEWTQQ